MTPDRFYRPAICFVCCLLLAATVSCAEEGPPRYELSGKITYKGKPVPAGSIRFEPIGSVINKWTVADAKIKDGAYTTLLDRGSTAGMHRIFVFGYNGIPEPGSGEDGASIFDIYVLQEDLPAETTTLDIVVPDTVRQMRPF